MRYGSWRRLWKRRSLSKKFDKMIAIVDDDASAREATGNFIRSLGYCTALFASAEEFLASDGVHTSACVISDVRMPGMSGVELQQRLVDGLAEIPVIFVTAFAEEHIRRRVLAAGAYGYLSKPFAPQRLVSCLDAAMKS